MCSQNRIGFQNSQLMETQKGQGQKKNKQYSQNLICTTKQQKIQQNCGKLLNQTTDKLTVLQLQADSQIRNKETKESLSKQRETEKNNFKSDTQKKNGNEKVQIYNQKGLKLEDKKPCLLKMTEQLNNQSPKKIETSAQQEMPLRFLTQSIIYKGLQTQQKRSFGLQMERFVNKKVSSTKLLFQGYEAGSFDQWLSRVQGKQNILVLLTLQNGFCIAGFSESPVCQQTFSEGRGFLMSITNKKVFPLKQKYKGKAASYDKYVFKFGNNELLIRSNLTFSVIFSKEFCYFDSGVDKLEDFIGQGEDEGSYTRVEFYQMLFE